MRVFDAFGIIIPLTLAAAMMVGPCDAWSASVREANVPEIWFSPLTWEVSTTTHQIEYSTHDFPKILQPGAPWQKAASHISVLSMPSNVVWSYPDLPSLVHFVRDHTFKTAFLFGMLFNDGLCQAGVEGVSQDHDFNHEAVTIARLWKAAGGKLDYVIMDAPLGYGHFLDASCGHSIDDVARRAAATLNGIRSYFPDVGVVDAEGPAWLSDPEWLTMMDEWLTAFKKHARQPINMIALDLHWVDLRPNNSWQATSQRSARFFHERGLRTGLIVNDGQRGPGVTDASWMDANRRHIADVADNGGLALDFLLINGWMGRPRNNLPEDDPLAYSGLVDFAYDALHLKNNVLMRRRPRD